MAASQASVLASPACKSSRKVSDKGAFRAGNGDGLRTVGGRLVNWTAPPKEEAVRQTRDRGYSVAKVSDRLGVSAHSLYKWLPAIKPDNSEQYARDVLEAQSEILRLWGQLKRTEEERDILKKATQYFAREPD